MRTLVSLGCSEWEEGMENESWCSLRVEGLMDSYTQGFERSYTVNSSILRGIEPRLKDFHQLLLCPPKVLPAFPDSRQLQHGHVAREGKPTPNPVTRACRDEQQESKTCVQGNLWDWGIEWRWEGMERKKLSVDSWILIF